MVIFYNRCWYRLGRPALGAIKGTRDLTSNISSSVLIYFNYDADAGHSLKLLGWKNLICQQQIERAKAPEYLSSKFERRETAYTCNLSKRP